MEKTINHKNQSNYNSILQLINHKPLIVENIFSFIKDEPYKFIHLIEKDEILTRLPKFFEFYFLYSKLFPNYTSILENKFLYNNIHQKQRMIDIQEEIEKEKKNVKKELKIKLGNENNCDIFSTDIINSLLN